MVTEPVEKKIHATGRGLSTPEGLLNYLLVKNSKGEWFVGRGDGTYHAVSRWMYPYCERALPNKAPVGNKTS